ncbi:hypothetical protein HCG95_12325 [Enterococcus durans]|nr:hypothetical protein [Enterococcus durans]MBX9078943.1 hypothetical protein [Enterococcus durans]
MTRCRKSCAFFNFEGRLGQKCLTPRNKKRFTKIAFQIFMNFGLFPKDLLLLPPFIRFLRTRQKCFLLLSHAL